MRDPNDLSSDQQKEPTSMAEYAIRFGENQKLSGYGIGNVYQHMPCPFCAAPGFLTFEILEVEKQMAAGATCKECKRGAKALFTRENGGVSFEIVQTDGPDQPGWLVPKMRRVS
jgi:hypothetical protein